MAMTDTALLMTASLIAIWKCDVNHILFGWLTTHRTLSFEAAREKSKVKHWIIWDSQSASVVDGI